MESFEKGPKDEGDGKDGRWGEERGGGATMKKEDTRNQPAMSNNNPDGRR